MNIAILGAGAWGTAMALHLHRIGDHRISLVPRRMEHALAIASSRENESYLPGFKLSQEIQIGCEIKPAIMEADVVILACPSQGLRPLCESIKAVLDSSWQLKMVITLCKGLERTSLLKPAEVVHAVLPELTHAALSGPTFAGEVAAGKPTAMVLASTGEVSLLKHVQAAINNDMLRIYRTSDVVGVELGGCLKNIYAIGVGICDGLETGDNSKAALMTRSMHEMVKLGVSLGGRVETFYGLSGFGDLVATCHGAWSRNRTFGQELGAGKTVDALMQDRKTVVEGYWATACFYELCQKHQQEAPILAQIYAIAYRGKAPRQAIYELMTRELKAEV